MTLLIAGISLILLAGLTVAAFSRHPSFGEAAFRVLVVLGCALGAIPSRPNSMPPLCAESSAISVSGLATTG